MLKNTLNEGRKRKAIVINEFGSDNLGDKLINISLCNELNKLGVATINYDFSKVRELSIKSLIAQYGDDFRISEVRRAIAKFLPFTTTINWFLRNHMIYRGIAHHDDIDFAVIGGGQLLLSNSYFILSLYLWVLALEKKRIPIYLIGVGAGEKFSLFDQILIKKVLNKVREVYVRDARTAQLISETFNVSPQLCPDVAYSVGSSKFNALGKNNTALIGVMNHYHYNRLINSNLTQSAYFDIWINKVSEFERMGYEIKLIYTTYLDYVESVNFQKYYLMRSNNTLDILNCDEVQLLEKHMSNASIVCSSRMHALIIAQCYGARLDVIAAGLKLQTFRDTVVDKEVLASFKKQLNEVLVKVVNNESI